MNSTTLSRNEGTATSPSEVHPNGAEKGTENGHALNGVAAENGHQENGQAENGTPAKAEEAGTGVVKRSAVYGLVEWRRDSRASLAVFCFEGPDSMVGRAVAGTAAALARRRTPVHLFSRQPFPVEAPDLHAHVLGDCDGPDLCARVEEFTRLASNAFLRQFSAGCGHVTLMGCEWSGAGPLGILRGIKNSRAIFSVHSLERQRSDMTSEISKRINDIEMTTLRESQVVLSQEPAAAEVARFWVPECADRLLAARQPFPVWQFQSKLDPGQVKARFQVGPVDPTILYIGDLNERYAPDLLIKAMPAILRNHKQARLIIAGEGAMYWPLRVYSRYLLLDHAVRLPGSVEGQSLRELIEAADVVAVPSRDSTPWWPIQAAWAAGRPVVATHQAAPRLLEHDKDSILTYPNEQSVVWGIERVLFDAQLGQALARNGREKLEERFGWNNVAEQVQELMTVGVHG